MYRYALAFSVEDKIVCLSEIYKVDEDMQPEDLSIKDNVILFCFFRSNETEPKIAEKFMTRKVSESFFSVMGKIERNEIENNTLYLVGKKISDNKVKNGNDTVYISNSDEIFKVKIVEK